MKNFIYGLLVITALWACLCQAAPEPAIVPGPSDWTVNVRFEHPQQIVVPPSAGSESKRFWYTIITLTNNTGRVVEFYPKCELMTDTYQITPAGKSTTAAVFEKIKRRHQGKYPFLEFLEKVDNKILKGRDNTRDIAVIWPDFDTRAKTIKIFIAGLSNETVVINHPVTKDKNGKPVKVFLRKTLELGYTVGGDAAFRDDARLIHKGKRWVMR
ncbi:MAG: hypothetical protein ACYS1A_02235 [Planctomycetota bacterium]|jgi:hypothetical protein